MKLRIPAGVYIMFLSSYVSDSVILMSNLIFYFLFLSTRNYALALFSGDE